MSSLDLRAASVDISGTVGDDLSITVTVVDSNGDAIDLSGYTTIQADVLRNGTSVATFTDSLGGAGNNVITLSLTDVQTTSIGNERGLTWSLEVDADGSSVTQWLAGEFRLYTAGTPGASGSTSVTLTASGAVSLTASIATGTQAALDGRYAPKAGAAGYQTFAPKLMPAPTVMSSAPTVTLSAAGAATGIASGTSYVNASGSTLATWWRMLGGGTPSITTVAGFNDMVGAATDWLSDTVAGTSVKGTSSVEFMTDSDDVEWQLGCLTSSSLQYRIWVDGQLAAANMSAGAGSGNATHMLRAQFASATPRLIRLELVQATFRRVRVPTTRSLWAPGDPLGPRVAIMGDSFSEGSGASWFQSWGWEMCHRLGWRDYYQSALGGTGYLKTGTSSRVKFRDRVQNDIIDHAPDIVIVAGGYNDDGNFTDAAVGDEAELLFAAIKAGLPSCKLVVVAPWQSNNGQLASLRTLRDEIFAAASSYADLTIDPLSATDGPWIFGTGYVGSTTGDGNADINVAADGVHYSTVGYQYIGARVAQEIANSTVVTPA